MASTQTSPQAEFSPPSNKRKNEELHPNGKKKARTRVSYSCSECHRRKQKCDRMVPCGHCVARKVPELCKGYTPGKTDGDLHARLSRVEQILENAFPHLSNAHSPRSQSPSFETTHSTLELMAGGNSRPSTPSESREDDGDTPSGNLQSGRWFGASAMDSVNSRPLLDQLHQADPPSEETGIVTDGLRAVVQEYGLAPHQLSELIEGLPPKPFCDVLVDYYFNSINYTRYPMHEPIFRSSYDTVWANGGQVQPNVLRFLPLLFVVLAIACRVAPESIAGDVKSRRQTSLQYYWRARRSMLLASAVQTDTIELVLARLLTSRFLTFDRRITEAWNVLGTAVRTAQALGLHRDGSKLGLDQFQTEYRRRIWAYVYHADRTHAVLLGRPPCIHDDHHDTHPPSNIDDLSLVFNSRTPVEPQPITNPTRITFSVLRNQLATIIGHIVNHFQQVRHHTHYSDVLALDEELQGYVQNLPPHYALDPDTSLDSTRKYIPAHRFIIVTEILFMRISLHRPYLLRKHDRYLPSRRACFEAAKKDFEVRQAFKRTQPKEVISAVGGAYREFQAVMISGISLVTDPHGPDSEIMTKILDTFLSDHSGPSHIDETTRREVNIIKLLKVKSTGKDDSRFDADQKSDAPVKEKAIALPPPANSKPSSVTQLLSHNPGQANTSPVAVSPALAASRSLASAALGELTPANSPANLPFMPAFTPAPNVSPSAWLRQRSLQHVQSPISQHGSPVTVPSPAAGDSSEESAQRLLDRWYGNVNSIEAQPFDEFGIFSGVDWDGGARYGVPPPDLNSFGTPGTSGTDSSIWESLVNHLRKG